MQKFSGKDYILIDIANHAGLDKLSWNRRIEWARNNMPDLEKMAGTAKHPVLFRKAVRALRATDRGEAIGFPMSLDATASGLQLLAVLSGCPTTAANVNLGTTGKREDFYGYIADKMSQVTGQTYTSAELKPAIMTHFYGSKKQPRMIFGDGTPNLIAFYSVLEKEAPGAMQAMSLIQSFWNPETTEHIWTMPDKHVIRAKVMQTVDKKIEIDELGHKTFTHRASVNAPQKRGLSLAANITHSVDGYVVREMVRRAKRSGFQLATIHDSFWAHPNNMNAVRKLYTQILADLAKQNILKNILDQLSPGWGSLKKEADISSMILQSEYALS